MIALTSRRSRVASAPLVFRASDCLDDQGMFALAYGKRLAANFSRASRKRVVDGAGRLVAVPNGMPGLGYVNGDLSLLMEPGRTNLAIRSEDFTAWNTQAGLGVSSNTAFAPDGTLTADTLVGDGLSAAQGAYITVTFTADGERCVALYARPGTGNTTFRFGVYDLTAATFRHRVRVSWSGGVPSVATTEGSGTIYQPEALWGGWYRFPISTTGIVAANANRLYVYTADALAQAGTVVVAGGYAIDAVAPGSHIPTGASPVTTAQDVCYFDLLASPRAMTIYLRGREMGQTATNARWYAITNAALGSPRILGLRSGNSVSMYLEHGSFGSSVPSLAFTRGGRYEMRHVLYADGTFRAWNSLNDGSEVAGGLGGPTTLGMPSAWAGPRFYLSDSSSSSAQFAHSHAAIAFGDRSRDEMRELAGV